MKNLSGLCVGGPLDLQMLTHWATEKKLYKPMFEYSFTKSPDDLRVEATPIGKYVWSDNKAQAPVFRPGKPFWLWVPA